MTVSVARTALRRLQGLAPRSRSGFTLFAYHLVGAGTSSPVDQTAELFDAQLDSLDGHVRTLDQALNSIESGHAVDQHDIVAVLTFDDAFANFYDQVYPRLRERNLPAVLCVPTGFIDGEQPASLRGAENLAPCTWEQLREMAESGLVSLGSHTVTHASLTHVDAQQAEWELTHSRARIEEMTGLQVRHFCYPRALWSKRLEPLVAREYATATIGGGGSVRPGCHPLRLQRVSCTRDFGEDLWPIVRSSVWLEERVADMARRIRN